MPGKRPSSDDARPGVTEAPSTVYALWPEVEPPMEEEIRLAIAAAFPGGHAVEDLDAGEGVLWGNVYRLPGFDAEFVIWAQNRSEAPDLFDDQAVEDAEDRARIAAAQWFIGVETMFSPRNALEIFHAQMRLAEAVSVAGLLAVYDDNAIVLRPGRLVRDLARAATPPRPSTLYAIHEMEGKSGTWLHTHGLTRLGMWEIELMGLTDAEVPDGYDLIDAVVDVLFGQGDRDEDDVLTIGDGLEVRLVDFDTAMSRLPKAVAATRTEHDVEDDDHKAARVVVMARDKDDAPRDVLARFRKRAVLFKSREETDRQRKLAMERFGVFGQLFAIHRREGWRFHAKLAFLHEGDPNVREHVWVEVRDLKPGAIRGVCQNKPVASAGVREGQDEWFALDQLTDWVVVAPHGNFDPESAPALLDD